MSATKSVTSRNDGSKLYALLELLRKTELEIAGLRADVGETAETGKHRALLMRRARRQRRQSDTARQAAILNALPACIALLDGAGNIVAANEAWKRCGGVQAEYAGGHAVGVNYLDVCDATARNGSSIARRVAAGVRSVLDSSQRSYSTEYSVRLSTRSLAERSSMLTVVPVDGDRPIGAVVMQMDVTAKRVIEARLRGSETRFRQMSENIDDVFFLRDLNGGRVLYVSPAYERIWGRTCASLLEDAQSWGESIHPEDRAAANAATDDAALTGRFAIEFRIIRPDGSIRWIDSRGFPVRDDAGEIVRIAGIAEDITERKQALISLRESEMRYRALTEASFDAISVSQDGIILEVNAGFERIFGYPAAEIVGRPATDFSAPDSIALVRTPTSSGMAGTYSSMGLRKDGTRILLDVTANVHELDGRPALTTALRDITARRQLEDQFRQAQKMEAVGRLAAGIAHDFNNQLSVIIAYAAFVHEDLAADDPRRADMEEVQKAANAAAALTRQLLIFSRQRIVAPRIVALDAIVADSDKMLRRLIGEDVAFVTTHSGEAATTLIDRGQVEQLVMNLVINARDAMPTGGTLTIETADGETEGGGVPEDGSGGGGRYVTLSVTDTGIGMDTETRAQIFEPFFTTKATGTGLGLATVYGIVKQCGGSISVRSEPGEGTSFNIRLPFVGEPADEADATLAKRAPLSGTESILVAEDSPSLRRAVCHALERFGYRVHEAPTGALALEFAGRGETVDLLLTDVIMPEMSGRTLAERFRLLRPGVKVLYMSGYTDDAVIRHGVLSSAVEYIEKPFSPDRLVRKVRDVLDVPGRG